MVEDLLSSIARGGKPAPVLKQLSTLQTFVEQRRMDKLEAALKELHSTLSLSEGESPVARPCRVLPILDFSRWSPPTELL